jgi:hypothetical protein
MSKQIRVWIRKGILEAFDLPGLGIIIEADKLNEFLLDHIDIHIEVPRVDYEKLSRDRMGETSAKIRVRLQAARDIQNKRISW